MDLEEEEEAAMPRTAARGCSEGAGRVRRKKENPPHPGVCAFLPLLPTRRGG